MPGGGGRYGSEVISGSSSRLWISSGEQILNGTSVGTVVGGDSFKFGVVEGSTGCDGVAESSSAAPDSSVTLPETGVGRAVATWSLSLCSTMGFDPGVAGGIGLQPAENKSNAWIIRRGSSVFKTTSILAVQISTI